MRKIQSGFSIPELLVVIVTIGILASIVIVSFRGFQNRAYDASIQSDFEGFAGIVEAYRHREDGTNDAHEYPRNSATLSTLSIKASKGAYNTSVTYNLTYCISNSGANAYKEFKLIGLSKSGSIFVMTQDGFVTHSLTASSLTSTVCNTAFGMGLVSNGLFAPNSWQTWVGNS